MLKAGFIGAGSRSQGAHYPNVHRLEQDVEMRAVCELDEERLDQVAKKYEFSQVYTDHKKMLGEATLDVIYCVMNEKWILQTAIDCMNAGKHIFIEKPPGANLEETEQLLEAAVSNNVFAVVGFQRRYTAVTREAMRVVAEKVPFHPLSRHSTSKCSVAMAKNLPLHCGMTSAMLSILRAIWPGVNPWK